MTAVVPTGAVSAAPTPRRGRGGGAGPDDSGAVPLTPWAGTGLGVAVIWMSLLVLIPLAAVIVKAAGLGVSGFWDAVTSDDAVSAITLTLGASAAVTVVNAFFGTIIAWVLARDDFHGKRVLETVIDIPFALPTIVAGLVMLTLYGENSPIGVDLAGAKAGIVIALLFVTLPFVVRTVQPVLEVLDRESELAATSLGAGGFTVFRRIVFPAILPAVLSGSALAFARAIGEYGSVVLISAGVQNSQVASMFVYNRIQVDKLGEAAAVATVLLAIAVVVILGMGLLQKLVAGRG